MALIRHHYLDTPAATLVADAPEAKSVTKAASRIFAAYGETVKYCAAGDARDWTTANDAGFLPVQLQQDTGDACSAVGTFRESLVVAFPSALQTWTLAVDPSAIAIDSRLYGVGSLSPLTFAGFARDLAFLTPFGFRSLTTTIQSDAVDDLDLGVPVDPLVRADMATTEDVGTGAYEPFGFWVHELGQYWTIFDMGTYSKAWVYTFSKSGKLSCWSEYPFPVRLTAGASLNGSLYLRSNTTLYELDADTFRDETEGTAEGDAIDVEVQMAFQNAKTPGVEKQFYGADFVFTGTANVSYKYDPRDQDKESTSQAIDGNTAPGQVVPVEIVSASVAPVVRHSADEAFEFTQMSLYYHPLVVT